jgi:hypothetical protein
VSYASKHTSIVLDGGKLYVLWANMLLVLSTSGPQLSLGSTTFGGPGSLWGRSLSFQTVAGPLVNNGSVWTCGFDSTGDAAQQYSSYRSTQASDNQDSGYGSFRLGSRCTPKPLLYHGFLFALCYTDPSDPAMQAERHTTYLHVIKVYKGAPGQGFTTLKVFQIGGGYAPLLSAGQAAVTQPGISAIPGSMSSRGSMLYFADGAGFMYELSVRVLLAARDLSRKRTVAPRTIQTC